jgi:hypothetical protein
MTELSTRRLPSSLAIERRLEALSLPALGLAGAAIALIQLSETWIHDGPFPKDMKTRFLQLYGMGSFGVLKLVVRYSNSSGGLWLLTLLL